jgi:hypothetical protein
VSVAQPIKGEITNKEPWKFQKTNFKKQINNNNQKTKFQTGLGHWILRFGIYLEIVF